MFCDGFKRRRDRGVILILKTDIKEDRQNACLFFSDLFAKSVIDITWVI